MFNPIELLEMWIKGTESGASIPKKQLLAESKKTLERKKRKKILEIG